MVEFIQQIAELGEQIIQFSWLPLLIWTVLGGLILLALRIVRGTHPQYQYHSRLALLFALPAGFIALGVIQYAGTIFSAPSESLTFISVTAPFELTISSTPSSSISTTTVLYSAVFLLFSIGLILFAVRNIKQWFQLVRLKAKCNFLPIQNLKKLDFNNRLLITETEKNIQIAFLEQEIIPVTFGINYPVILFPNSLKKDEEKLNLVLRHELTHIIQNDFLSNVIISFTQIFFWFHPFVHFLKRELIDYREIRCDSLVLSNNSVSRKKYASLLLELLPMPNINKELSVNMAQESSNLKKRIQMITQQKPNRPIPKRSSIAIFAFIILSTAVAMSCTDMQSNKVFDEEDLNLMTDIDQTGERGYHQVLIFMGDEEQSERHKEALEQLNLLEPEHIHSVEVFKGDMAIEKYGERASKGVIVINTKPDPESYNTVLGVLGMEPQEVPPPPPTQISDKEDYFVVVEDMPQLKGGLEGIMKNVQYPEEARQKGIEGRVYVQFVVNEAGDVEDAKVIRGIGAGADAEALRVVRQAKFEPGYQHGKPVRVQFSLPIFFRLDGSGNSSTPTPEPPANSETSSLIIPSNSEMVLTADQ